MFRPPPTSTLFPYTTLFRSDVDHAATRRIEQDRAWLHLCEPSRIDEIARLRIQRHVQAHRIGARKQRVEIDPLDIVLGPGRRLRSDERIAGDDAHAECTRPARRFARYRAEADESKRA